MEHHPYLDVVEMVTIHRISSPRIIHAVLSILRCTREPPFKSFPKVIQNPVYGLMSEARLLEFLRQVYLSSLMTKK